MTTHERGGRQREESKDPQINQIIYNLETGRVNNIPGAVIVGPVKEEQIARSTERKIKNWFKDQMGWKPISKEEQDDGFTETFKITVPKEVKYPAPGRPKNLEPASVARFTPDAMASVMQKIIEHIMDNDGIITPFDDELQYDIALNFGFDTNLLHQLFGTNFGAELGFNETILNYDPVSKTLPEIGQNFETQIPPQIEVGPNLEEKIEQPEQSLYERSVSPYQRQINEQGRQQEIANMLQNGLAYQDEQGNIVDVKTNQIIQKTSDHQGWSNWDTWNTALMIDNEQWSQTAARKIVYDGGTEQDLANWATPNIIGPTNQEILRNAQEWNEIPYDERPTGREDLSERMKEMAESFDALFGKDPQSDEVPDLIEEDKVNWNEIYENIADAIRNSEEIDHDDKKHDLTGYWYADFTPEEIAEEQKSQFPWCPICNPQNPDAPGDLTIPENWTGF